MAKIKVATDGILGAVEAIASICEVLDRKGLVSKSEMIEVFTEQGHFFGRRQNDDGVLVMTYLISRIRIGEKSDA